MVTTMPSMTIDSVMEVKMRPKLLAGVFAGLLITLVTLSGTAHALPNASHSYGLNGTYADALGGPALVPHGGVIDSTKYSFGAGQGLSLSNALGAAAYSIEMRFQLFDISGYVKLIDWLNRTSDTGLYALNGSANFYNISSTTRASIAARKYVHCVITRNGSNKKVEVYINGKRQLTFVDTTNLAVSTPPKRMLYFFQDDLRTSSEDSPGVVDYIRLYNAVLTARDAADLARGLLPPNVRQR
jgi:hypothetical protein